MAGEMLARLALQARAEELQRVRDTVREVAARHGCAPQAIEEMVIGVNEACMNIIQHGYHCRPEGEIVLEIIAGQGEMIFRLSDQAPCIDPQCLVSRPLHEVRPGGLGLHFIHSVMDGADYQEGQAGLGNVLEMRKKISTQG